MTWQDRLKEGAYNSPSGVRHTFKYEDLSRSFDKKTSAHDFPNADGTYIQDNGRTGRKYPITAYFSGPNCDTDADAFEDALGETGRGKLEHPIYGTVDVVPFGTITRNDALKSAANQSVVEVTFWETIPLIYPIPQSDPQSIIIDAVQEFTGALGISVADKLDIFDPATVAQFKDRVIAQVNSIKTTLGKISEIKTQVEDNVTRVLALADSISAATTETADAVRGVINETVSAVMELIALPSQVAEDLKTKITSYKEMLGSVLSPLFPTDDESEFLSSTVMAETITASLAVNMVESELSSQGEATSAADELLSMFDEVVTWGETTSDNLGLLDTGESYQKLQETIALTAGYLIEISFTLKKERKIILTESCTIIDLAARLYGELDTILDFFINSNEFTGSEIIEVPKGREVLYYV